MKKTIMAIVLLVATTAFCQTSFDIDLNDFKLPSKVDLSKPFVITFKHCEDGNATISLSFLYKTEKPEMLAGICGNELKVDLLKWSKRAEKIEVKLTVNSAVNTDKKTLDTTFFINPDGTISLGNKGSGESNQNKTEEAQVPIFTGAFVDDKLFTVADQVSKDCGCQFPVIEYDPCCNKYSILECPNNSKDTVANKANKKGIAGKNKELHYLRYNKYKNKGVVFRIKNFNLFKYDVTMSNEFVNSNTDIPELFATASKLMTTANKLESKTDEASLKIEVAKLIKLQQDLKAYIEFKNAQQDCNIKNFETEKAVIIANIQKYFGSLDIAANYDAFKADYIHSMPQSAAYDEKKFNDDFKKKWTLDQTPDEIVKAAKTVFNLLINTSFVYQYNVPQLQNADKIVFKLGIQPKKDMNGAIHMADQPIEVPLYGGWKIDFTTGFYYSSIRNESYGLSPQTVNGVAVNAIVKENVAGDGRRTAGAAALMHIYPRWGYFQPSLAFGMGTALDLNYSFLVGGGFIIGKENRLALTGGLNYSNVKTLSKSQINADGSYANLPADAKSVNTFSRFKQGLFLSVTYSLGLTKTTQQAAKTDTSATADAAKTDSAKK